MRFFWPSVLWLLLVAPVLVAGYLHMHRRRLRMLGERAGSGLFAGVLQADSGLRRHLPPLMFLVALVATVVAVARPAAVITLPSQRGVVMLAVDVSASMLEGDIEPSRLIAAQRAVSEFVAEQPRNVHIGLVAFSSSAWLLQAPTLDRNEVIAAVQRLHTYPATAMGSGILVSLATIFEGTDKALDVEYLEYGGAIDPWRERSAGPMSLDRRGRDNAVPPDTPEPVAPGSLESAAVIVLSDGASNRGPDPVAMARLAADLGVRVYTVGLGTEDAGGGFFGRASYLRLDEPTLIEIAEITGGAYYPAGSEGELRDVYRTLTTAVRLEAEPTELTALFAALAGLIALAGALLSLLWFNRLA